MTEPPATPSVTLERVAAPAAPIRAADALLSDDEIRRAYRIAEALWKSGAYKDVTNAEKAFAKIIIGRDLGLSPAQSMGGVHLVEGGVQMHYAMLGTFVRARDGYDYRSGWLKLDHDVALEQLLRNEGRPPTEREQKMLDEGVPVVVWHDEEDPADLREIVGAIVDFVVDGRRRGISRFTLDDARKAQLIKDHAKAAWNAAPRNMLIARAMSNGIKWYVPEVLGGLPIYVDGELDGTDRPSLTAPAGEAPADDTGQGIDLGPDVEWVIARAVEVGHRGLANRAAVETALGGRDPGIVRQWVGQARAALEKFVADKAAAEEGDPPQEDAGAGASQGAPVAAPETEPTTPEAPETEPPVEEVSGTVEPPAEASRDPRDHYGHAIVATSNEGAVESMHCRDCDVVLDMDAGLRAEDGDR